MRIIKFMNFNGGHLSFRPPGGGGVRNFIDSCDRSNLFWMSQYKLITVYTRAISRAKNNNYTVVWLGGAEPPPLCHYWGGSRPPSPPPPPLSAATDIFYTFVCMHVCALCVYMHECVCVCVCVYSVLLELMGTWEQLDVNTITLNPI